MSRPNMMINLTWILYFSLSPNALKLDCAYVQDPQYTIQQETLSFTGAYPLESCRIETNMQLFSGVFASQFVCDTSGNLYVSIWNHTNLCNNNIPPTYYIPIDSSTEYNCNSTNECEHITLETYTVDNECTTSSTPIFRDTEIANKCIDIESILGNMSYILSSCDNTLGIFTITYYESLGCTGIIHQIFNVSGEGTFELGEQFEQFGQWGYYVTSNCQMNNSNNSTINCDLPSNGNNIDVQIKSKPNITKSLLIVTLSMVSFFTCSLVIFGLVLVSKLVQKTVFTSIPNRLDAMQTLGDTNDIHKKQENQSSDPIITNENEIDNTGREYHVELVDIMEDVELTE